MSDNTKSSEGLWQILDVRVPTIKEFGSALGRQVPTLGWLPRISATAILRNDESETVLDDPVLSIRHFPLQRGFARFPVREVAKEDARMMRRLLRRSDNPL